jgi:hypothetical protein
VVFLRSMSLLSTAFDSRYPVLLCLVVGSGCLWQSTRNAAFEAPGALLALLLLAHPPVLLLIRFSMQRDVAVPFTLTLFGSSLLVLRAVGPVFQLALPPPRWRWLTRALLLLDATIAIGWSYIPLDPRLLPGWSTAALVIGVEAGFAGLLLYWFWHAQQPSGLWSPPDARLSPPLVLAQRAYDQQAADLQPTAAEFEAWLRTLPSPAHLVAQQAGIKPMWAVPLFRRFVLELRGQRCVDFMAGCLDGEEFRRWVDATYVR